MLSYQYKRAIVIKGKTKMLNQLNPALSEIQSLDIADYVDEALIEKLWHELNEQIPREQIYQVATQVFAQFQNVTVTNFLPIFIYRQTLEKLKPEVEKSKEAL